MAYGDSIFDYREGWQRPLAFSVGLHAALLAAVLLFGSMAGSSASWGQATAGEGAMSAVLVSKMALPLPKVETPTENVLANESKGLTQSEPQAKVEPPPEAIPIPKKNARVKEIKPGKAAHPSTPEKITPTARPRPVAEAVPFGGGGPVDTSYKLFSLGGSAAGLGTPQDSDFSSRYGWYVDVVRRKVSENWLKYEIDPAIQSARRVYITFDIARGGQPGNVQVEQSSGVPSLDVSAVRALQRIETFGALPADYSGNRVRVEFWFEYRH